MATLGRVASVAVVFGIAFFPVGCGTGSIRARQMNAMKAPQSKEASEVLAASAAVLRERFYQVKEYAPDSRHIVAFTPVDIVGNHPVRKRIDVHVFLENGFYMPQVSVRQFIDAAEPPMEQGGPITARFPTEVSDHPVATQDWEPLIYDRNDENELRNAILARLKVRTYS